MYIKQHQAMLVYCLGKHKKSGFLMAVLSFEWYLYFREKYPELWSGVFLIIGCFDQSKGGYIAYVLVNKRSKVQCK